MIDVAPAEPGWAIVTFRLPADITAERIAVVGDFNDWAPDATVLASGADGISTSVRVRAGRSYRFRYLVAGERWANDWEADDYVDNELGGSDSVVEVAGDGARGKTARPTMGRTA